MNAQHGDAGRRRAIGLVGCGKSKLAHAAPARELYTGTLFRKSLAYAERTCDLVYIVSAKHELLELDQPVEPYDHTLSGLHIADRLVWAHVVCNQLAAAVGGYVKLRGADLVLLVGEVYSQPLELAANKMGFAHIYTPLEGMQIGQRLHFLSQEAA
jgi:hypothetical protein